MVLPKTHKKHKRLAVRGKIFHGKVGNKTTAELWFKSISWATWWHEFMTSRKPGGEMAYFTAWEFCQKKEKDKLIQKWIFRCIGPKPLEFKKLHIKVHKYSKSGFEKLPFLGDWQAIRAKAYFSDNSTVMKLRSAMQEQMDGLEAGRSSASFILDLIAKWLKYDDKLDALFDLENIATTAPVDKKEKLCNLFFNQKNKTRHALQELVTQFLQCHGINQDGISDLGQLVLAVSKSSASAALTGAAVAGGGPQISPALYQLSKAIEDKHKTFGIPLPSALMNGHDKHEETIEVKLDEKKNGHS